jgi:ABC-2 type transport system ATP-binding protein
VISAQGLTRRFAGRTAIEDLSFEVGAGEVVGFLGPNGAGKTTTLRILAGYLPASAGSARVAGHDVLTESLAVRRRIGYLPESVPLYREMRVAEMLAFHGRLHGLERDELRRRSAAALERFGIADRARQPIGELSRGLRQRVGLALALLPAPAVLILDEPTSGLDPLQRIEIRELVRELAREHTVLISSHILPEIEAVCPRVIILDRGRIAADGTQAELVARHGGASALRFDAAVGADVEGALRLLRAISGVRAVADLGRLGVHHQFELDCAGDVREEVGALALVRKWAVRELSWRRPTLEQVFARIALGIGERAGAPPPPPAAAPAPRAPIELPLAPPASAPRKVVYNLNPFDMGATRDLGKPKAVEPGDAGPARAEHGPPRG